MKGISALDEDDLTLAVAVLISAVTIALDGLAFETPIAETWTLPIQRNAIRTLSNRLALESKSSNASMTRKTPRPDAIRHEPISPTDRCWRPRMIARKGTFDVVAVNARHASTCWRAFLASRTNDPMMPRNATLPKARMAATSPSRITWASETKPAPQKNGLRETRKIPRTISV